MILLVCSAVRDMYLFLQKADAELVQRHRSMKLHKLRWLDVKVWNKLAIVARAGGWQQERVLRAISRVRGPLAPILPSSTGQGARRADGGGFASSRTSRRSPGRWSFPQALPIRLWAPSPAGGGRLDGRVSRAWQVESADDAHAAGLVRLDQGQQPAVRREGRAGALLRRGRPGDLLALADGERLGI